MDDKQQRDRSRRWADHAASIKRVEREYERVGTKIDGLRIQLESAEAELASVLVDLVGLVGRDTAADLAGVSRKAIDRACRSDDDPLLASDDSSPTPSM
jgi:hypothetical protein